MVGVAALAWLPEVGGLTTVAEVLASRDAAHVAMAHPGGVAVSLERPVVLVGPEGGWAPEELAVGLPTVGLGPTVLRVETAAVAAGVLLCGLRSGVVGPRSPGAR